MMVAQLSHHVQIFGGLFIFLVAYSTKPPNLSSTAYYCAIFDGDFKEVGILGMGEGVYNIVKVIDKMKTTINCCQSTNVLQLEMLIYDS